MQIREYLDNATFAYLNTSKNVRKLAILKNYLDYLGKYGDMY